MTFHREVASRYRFCFDDKKFCVSAGLSILALLASAFVNFYAGTYATMNASNPVTDIILSNTKVYDVDGLFVYGSIALILFVALLCLVRPRRIAFVCYSVSLFVIIRSIFITLTHIGPFPSETPLNLGVVTDKFIFGGDLFFSGHVGIPFLLGLIFWRNKTLRYIFIVWSVAFGVIALLGHLHYTIDVVSAFFITYAIYHIALQFFPKEHEILMTEM